MTEELLQQVPQWKGASIKEIVLELGSSYNMHWTVGASERMTMAVEKRGSKRA